MANKIKLKQSSVSGKVPTTTDLELGELGINTYDGKLFLKKKVGVVETIIDVTGAASGVTSVGGSAPIISSGGVTPSISISAATTLAAGSMSAADKAKIDAVTGTNTGDETASTIKTKLGITTLSGSNTGDQVIPVASSTAPAALGTAAVGTGTTFARADHVHTLPSLATLGAQAAGSYVTVGGALGTPSSGTLTNCTFPTLNQNTTGTASSCTGNAATATTLIGDQTNWTAYRTSAVANMLGWKNYGNGHVIFDASQSTSPTGSAVNNTNAQGAWTASYPTLMGWNGSATYGVRVDSARISDSTSGSSASCTGNAASATTATSQSGGTVSATTGAFSGTTSFPCAQGAFNIQNGTGDGASFTVYNTAIHSHWGIGFRDYQDLTTVKAYIDCRSGNIGTSGSFVGNLSGNAATATTAGALQGLTSGANGSIYTDVNWAMLLQGFTNGGSFGWRPTNAVSIAFSCSNTGNLNAIGTISGTNITTGGNVTGSSASCTGNAVTATSLTTIVGSAPSYACRAWVNFNGTGTVAIRASGNVSSITDNGGGDYTVNFTTAMPDAKYSAVANCNGVSTTSLAPHMFGSGQGIASYTASSVKIQLEHGGVSPADREVVTVAIFR
jgi:hypothetical protein